MIFSLTWLPGVLKDAGLKVAWRRMESRTRRMGEVVG